MSWDEQLAEDFLQEYRKHECLWNPFHRQFHDCLAKGEALKKVVKKLRLAVGVQDCLRLLKCIREKYIETQTKNLLTLRSGRCHQPKWMQIVESMLKKIVCDEECKSSYLAPLCAVKTHLPNRTVKVLFRHTIASRKRKCPPYPKQRRRRKYKRQEGKLERRGRCCSNNADRNMDRRTAQDCSRSQASNWCKQRDEYLDNLAWQSCESKPIECPGLASHIERCSRIENVGKDTCATTPVYMCPNRSTHTSSCNQNHGRRRQTDIYPTITEPRSCKSPPRPVTCPPPSRPVCPPRKPSPERNTCSSPKKEKKPPPRCPTPTRCPTPPRCPTPVENRCPVTDKKDACTRDTCPNYTNNSLKACEIKPECPDRSVHFNRDSTAGVMATCIPQVAARFENGVLEAYSQFKVVFPSQDQQQQQQKPQCSSKKKCCTQKVQTDSTSRECAVGVTSRELLRGNRSSNRRTMKKDRLCGTDEDFVECPAAEDPRHDYVLLTPGGKYVPLVKRNDDCNDDEQLQCTCSNAVESNKKQDACCEMNRSRVRDNSPGRNCEKQSADEDKCCPSTTTTTTTTKLLLRCLEHMLNLEEQQSTAGAAAKVSDSSCTPCRRNKEREQRLAENASSSCLPNCLEERLVSNPRGKLTQNFLEILKCAMELDCNDRQNNNNDEEEEDEDHWNVRVVASSTLINDDCKGNYASVRHQVSMREVAVGGGATSAGCCVESKATQNIVSSSPKAVQCDPSKNGDKQVKRETVLDNLLRCSNWSEYNTAHNLSVALKCGVNDNCVKPNVMRVPATTLPAPTQQPRDRTLACLREELQRDKELLDQGKVSYIKCNQVYRSYVVRSPHTSPPRLSYR